MLKWKKDKHAPIADYRDITGRFRIYQCSVTKLWCLQDFDDEKTNTSTSREPVAYEFTLTEAKQKALYISGKCSL